MTYWELIIKEVVNKNDPETLFYYTHRRQTVDLKARKSANLAWKNQRVNKYYSLGDKFPDVKFTQRESECMREALKGKTIPKIAEVLNLSSRTVEFYMTKLRRKVKAENKTQLITFVLQSDFLKNFGGE